MLTRIPLRIITFCEDLEIEVDTDIVILALAWKWKVQEKFCFSRSEFVRGCRNNNWSTFSDIKRGIPTIRNSIWTKQHKYPHHTKQKLNKKFYLFAFNYTREENSRTINQEMAVCLWKLIFEGDCAEHTKANSTSWKFFKQWCHFVREYPNTISRDTWIQFYDFRNLFQQIDDYNPIDAWPIVMDEFVAHLRIKMSKK